MELKIVFKPYKIKEYNNINLNNVKELIYAEMMKCSGSYGIIYSSKFDNYGRHEYNGVVMNKKETEVWVYNIQHMKRGRHHRNKKVIVYIYKFDINLINTLHMNIKQYSRYFKIYN